MKGQSLSLSFNVIRVVLLIALCYLTFETATSAKDFWNLIFEPIIFSRKYTTFSMVTCTWHILRNFPKSLKWREGAGSEKKGFQRLFCPIFLENMLGIFSILGSKIPMMPGICYVFIGSLLYIKIPMPGMLR